MQAQPCRSRYPHSSQRRLTCTAPKQGWKHLKTARVCWFQRSSKLQLRSAELYWSLRLWGHGLQNSFTCDSEFVSMWPTLLSIPSSQIQYGASSGVIGGLPPKSPNSHVVASWRTWGHVIRLSCLNRRIEVEALGHIFRKGLGAWQLSNDWSSQLSHWHKEVVCGRHSRSARSKAWPRSFLRIERILEDFTTVGLAPPLKCSILPLSEHILIVDEHNHDSNRNNKTTTTAAAETQCPCLFPT